MASLFKLHLDIDARVQAIQGQRADWPCGKGCDACCRHLAEVPQLTAPEWALLREGLAVLAPERLHEVSRDMAALAAQTSRPIVCPLLDQSSGACQVYAQRPVACRTYGFYVQRDKGLYCHSIESRVSAGALDDVVWGNHDPVDHLLSKLGDAHALTEWFELWESGKEAG